MVTFKTLYVPLNHERSLNILEAWTMWPRPMSGDGKGMWLEGNMWAASETRQAALQTAMAGQADA